MMQCNQRLLEVEQRLLEVEKTLLEVSKAVYGSQRTLKDCTDTLACLWNEQQLEACHRGRKSLLYKGKTISIDATIQLLRAALPKVEPAKFENERFLVVFVREEIQARG